MLNLWIDAFIKPKETFEREKANASLGGALINYLIAGLILGVISFLANMLLSALLPIFAVLGALSLVLYPILEVIGSAIIIGVIFIIAKLLGGNGSYTSMFYLVSLYAPVVAILSLFPIVSLLVQPTLFNLFAAAGGQGFTEPEH